MSRATPPRPLSRGERALVRGTVAACAVLLAWAGLLVAPQVPVWGAVVLVGALVAGALVRAQVEDTEDHR